MDELHQRRVGRVPAVPIALALDLDRAMDQRQAGRSQDRVDGQFLVAEYAQRAVRNARRRDQQTRTIRCAQRVEIDFALQRATQRVEIERIELERRKRLRERLDAGRNHVQRQERRGDAHPSPEALELLPRALAAAFRHAGRHQRRIDRAGARAADRVEFQVRRLQQAVEHAPGEGAVGAAALQRQRQMGGGRRFAASGQHVERLIEEPHERPFRSIR